MRGINNQINELDNTIYLNELDIYRLRKELDTLKLKYAKSIVFAYKSRGSYEYLNFLFSARNFNDAIKRMAYLKSYRQNRETQAIAIAQSRAMLTQKVDVLNTNKKERVVTLTAQSQQLKVLQEDKNLTSQEQDKVRVIRGLNMLKQVTLTPYLFSYFSLLYNQSISFAKEKVMTNNDINTK